ncbi:hypothetical protein, partial [Prevotella koreensis]
MSRYPYVITYVLPYYFTYISIHTFFSISSKSFFCAKTAKCPSDHLRSKGHFKIKRAATYSPALHCSTIGAGGLNFSV